MIRSGAVVQGQSAVNMKASGVRAPCVDDGSSVDLPNKRLIVFHINEGLPF